MTIQECIDKWKHNRSILSGDPSLKLVVQSWFDQFIEELEEIQNSMEKPIPDAPHFKNSEFYRATLKPPPESKTAP